MQAPGITQDADVQGGIHIRNEHANIAYRFNGILLPEGVQGFGQVLEINFIGNMTLLTGTLPAQYGLRTAGVLDINTRIPNTTRQRRVGVYGGSHETVTPSFEYGGVVGQTEYFATGRYWGTDIGLNNTIPDRQAIHDNTAQGRGFAYMSTLLDPADPGQHDLRRLEGQVPDSQHARPAARIHGCRHWSVRRTTQRRSMKINTKATWSASWHGSVRLWSTTPSLPTLPATTA